MLWRVLVALALTACNGLLGLDETSPDSLDVDHDGVIESEDNCPGLWNPDQADIDADGQGDECDESSNPLICDVGTPSGEDIDGDRIDDGCDPCITGMLFHDEDQDGIEDACDRCPADADADQPDADGDGIGDACDRSAAFGVRLLFDGFGQAGAPGASWATDATGWTVTSDDLQTEGLSTLMVAESLGRLTGSVDGSWSVNVSFDLPPVPMLAGGAPHHAPQSTAGIALTDLGGAVISCGVRFGYGESSWQLVAQTGDINDPTRSTYITATSPIRLELRFSEKAGNIGFVCTIPSQGDEVLPSVITGSIGSYRPSLYADRPTRFHHVDIVR